MSDDLRDLYQEVILDHNKKPRNFRMMSDANRKAEGYNPLCGDKVTVFAKVEGGVLKDLAFQGSGCAISTSSASLMTEQLKGKTESEVKEIPGVTSAKAEVVWEPTWTKDMMSEAAKLQLGVE